METSQARYLKHRGMQAFAHRYPNMREACGELFDYSVFKQQLTSFEIVRDRFQSLIKGQEQVDPNYYGGVPRLKIALLPLSDKIPDIGPLPSLARLISLERGMQKTDDPNELGLSSVASKIFTTIAGLIDSGEWGYVKNLRYPGHIIAALLIEGYGLMLEHYYGVEGMRHNFVIGFEEILWNEQRSLKETVRNVLPWMIEERSDFSQEVHEDLETLYILQNSSYFSKWSGIRNQMPTDFDRIPHFSWDQGYRSWRFTTLHNEDNPSTLIVQLTEKNDLDNALVEIKEILQEQSKREYTVLESRSYDRPVLFVDLYIPKELKEQIVTGLSKGSMNEGFIEESVFDAGQQDIIELVFEVN